MSVALEEADDGDRARNLGIDETKKQLAETRSLGESQFGNIVLHIPYFGFDKSKILQGEKMGLFP